MLDYFTDHVNKKKNEERDFNDWEEVSKISTYANNGNNAIYRPDLNYIEFTTKLQLHFTQDHHSYHLMHHCPC